MVLPRNATTRVPPPGSWSRCCSKSPTTAWTSTPRTPAATAVAAARRVCFAHVERHEAFEGAGVARTRRAGAASSPTCPNRARRACRPCCAPRRLAACSSEDAPLGAGRVVLGQARDLVEQLAAAVVVEPLRRERLRRARRARHARRLRARASIASGPRWTSMVMSAVDRVPFGSRTFRSRTFRAVRCRRRRV